jgi:hypothetical protein
VGFFYLRGQELGPAFLLSCGLAEV